MAKKATPARNPIREVQIALNSRGYGLSVTGKFDPETKHAVTRFQKAQTPPMLVTGRLDHTTYARLGVTP